MKTVTIQSSSSLNQPYFVLDMSQEIITEVIEEVTEVKEDMILISERFNPFFKQTVYKVKRNYIDYKNVFTSFDYHKATSFARYYAKHNNLKVQF